jgi:glutathione S-transferase
MLAYKGLSFHSVVIPPVMPRPLLTPVLTGGYRKTPVLQVGADVYCDTRCIARWLDRVHPERPLFHDDAAGLCEVIASWVEPRWFLYASALSRFRRPGDVRAVLGADVHPRDFLFDRSRFLRGTDVSVLRSARLAYYAYDQLRGFARFVDGLLSSGRSFFGGERPSLADFSAYHPLWMLALPPEIAGELLTPRIRAWMARIDAIGEPSSTPLTAEEALSIARAAEPSFDSIHDDPLRQPGHLVTVTPDDYGKDDTTGELVSLNAYEVCILRRDPVVGNVAQHFPVLGFRILPAGQGARFAEWRTLLRSAREWFGMDRRDRAEQRRLGPSIDGAS